MDRRRAALAASFACVFAALVAFRGCAAREGCLAGDDGTCVPKVPCATLTYACSYPELEVRRIARIEDRPAGLDALAAPGDILIQNDRFRLVLDGLGAPHYIAPSGGALLDLVPRRANAAALGDDELNHAFQATGILPGDAVRYTRVEVDDQSPSRVAVILRGALDGRPRVTVVTRYEARPCEPGVRVRTELFHGGKDPETFFLSDAFYWGGRESVPFAPIAGRGFTHPHLDLAKLGDAFGEQPFFAAKPVRTGAASYAVVSCVEKNLAGFHSNTISAVGLKRTIVMPGDALAFERFVVVGPGPGVAGAVSEAYTAREQIFAERSVLVRGRVVHPQGHPVLASENVSLLFYEPGPTGTDATIARTPLNEAVPDAEGRFVVRLPRDRELRVERHVLGRPLPEKTNLKTAADIELPDLVVPDVGVLEARVVDGQGKPLLAEVVLTPSRGEAAAATRGSIHGAFDLEHCTPWLGPPHGGSPACNRALTEKDGKVSLAVPPGTYFVYATRGPFSTIARQEITVGKGGLASVNLAVDRIPGLLPEGSLSADFHVHGGASFDSSLPDRDRARTFVAANVDVLAATDHDVVTTYADAIRELGIEREVRVMPGAETTGHVLFYRPPGSEIPKVVGHYNFWPLLFDPALPRNGLPWDELLEPGPLFDRVSTRFTGPGVIQFNHPLAGTEFGRDQGFLAAIGYDARKPIPLGPDGAPTGQLARRAGGRSALDYHVQEVMNGTSTRAFHDYRLGWHAFLNQGIVRGGTANSDSHTLAIEVLGYPRNLVFGGHTLAGFDVDRFNADVRAGRMIGTNGPVVVATIDGRGPSLEPFRPDPAAFLTIAVRAAPWIPVEEVRVLVNGRVARLVSGPAVKRPTDPFGKGGVERYTDRFPVSELLAGLDPGKDAWIVIEAGLPLVPAKDLDGDGYLDTTDNDGDGVIDDRDRAGRDEEKRYVEPGRPAESDPRFHAQIVAPGHWSTAFTNPFLLDLGADGWTGPAR